MEDCRLHLLHLDRFASWRATVRLAGLSENARGFALNYIDNLDARLEMIFAGYPIAKPLAARIFERVRPLPGKPGQAAREVFREFARVELREGICATRACAAPRADILRRFRSRRSSLGQSAAPQPRNFQSRETDRAFAAFSLGRGAECNSSPTGRERSPDAVALSRAPLDSFVRNEPGVAAATPVAARRCGSSARCSICPHRERRARAGRAASFLLA